MSRARRSEKTIAKAEKRGQITPEQAGALRKLNARITHHEDQQAAAKAQRRRGGQ